MTTNLKIVDWFPAVEVNFLVVGPLGSVLDPSQIPVHGNRRYSAWNRKSNSVPSSAKVKNEWRVTTFFSVRLHGTLYNKLKVKWTVVQALRLCTGRTGHIGSRGIDLLFHDRDTRRRWGVSVTPRPFFTSGERPGTHCIGGWVGPRVGLDRCGKSRPHRDSIPGPSSPQPVAIPTALPGPRCTITRTLTVSWV